jgi:uncharacterized protein YcbK (DUF882 family)
MKLTANITLDELTKSQIAERKGINNNPNPAQIENLKALAVNILQPVRSHFEKPLIISSGFRCAQLCVEIGSSVNSHHVADNNCAAADFEIPGVDNRELALWIKSELEYDQINEPTSGWVHCCYSSDHNRNQPLRAFREDGKVVYKPWLE